MSPQLKVLAAEALKPAMIEAIAQFERSSGHKVTIDYGTAGSIASRLQNGEAADVVIVSAPQIPGLQKQGKVVAGNPVDFAKSGVGIFTRQGAPKPDVSSVESLKRTLLAAKSIAHADPSRGGMTAPYVADLLGRLDIGAGIKPKIKLFAPGVYDLVAEGDVEIGFGGISEIMADPGVELVGPLPPEIQNYTLFVGGVVASSKEQEAAKALIQFLSSSASAAILKAKGFEAH